MKKFVFALPLCALFLYSCDNCNDCGSPVYNYALKLYDVQENAEQRQVSLLFQVLQEESKGVANLTEDDFVVLENDEPIDTEANKTIDPQSIPSRVSTVLLLDISSSVSDFIGQLKEASISLIDQKLPNQKFAIFTFDKQTRLVQDFTHDNELLLNKINTIPNEALESSTNLYGAIIDVTNDSYFTWQEHYAIDSIVEYNLIVFTDGRHNANPSITLDQAVSSVQNKKVYVAALRSDDLREVPLRQIATEDYFLAQNIGQVKDKFREVQNRIVNLSNSLYYMYYTSPISDPAARENTLEVRIKNNRPGENNVIKTKFNSGGFR